MLTYDETVSHLIFGLVETLTLQAAMDDDVRKEARRLAWEILRSWSSKLDRSERSMGNLVYDLGPDAETFWHRNDMAVLIARLRVRAEEMSRWTGERPAD